MMEAESADQIILSELSNTLNTDFSCDALNVSFMELGGNSFLALQLTAACHRRGVEISMRDLFGCERILELFDKTRQLNELCEPASRKPSRNGNGEYCGPDEEHRAPFDSVTNRFPSTSFGETSQVRLPVTEKQYRMTEMQANFLSQSLRYPGTNIISYKEEHRVESIPRLRAAWETVINAEEIFWTVFDLESRMCLVPRTEDACRPFRWSEIFVHDEGRYQVECTKAPLDVTEGSAPANFFRVVHLVGRKFRRRSTVIWYVHHVYTDGYSASLLLRNVYNSLSGNALQPCTPFSMAAQELHKLQSSDKLAAGSFWQAERLAHPGAAQELAIYQPSTHPSNLRSSRVLKFSVPSSEIVNAARKASVFPATLFIAAWGLTLAKHMDAKTVVFGTMLSGRDIPIRGFECTIGPMVNTLPLNLDIDPSWSVSKYLEHVFLRLQELSKVSWSCPDQGFDRSFPTAINVNLHDPVPISCPEGPIARPEVEVTMDLPFVVDVQPGGVVSIRFHENSFEVGNVRLIAHIFEAAISLMLQPNVILDALSESLMTPTRRTNIMKHGNAYSASTTEGSVNEDLLDLFYPTVRKHGERVALERSSAKMTYQELDKASSKISWYLKDILKSNPGDVVCVESDRSIDWIVAVYGVLKAGCVYCPVDPSLPDEFRRDVLRDSQAVAFLVSDSGASFAEERTSASPVRCSVREILSGKQASCPRDRAVRKAASFTGYRGNLRGAYICFTSGSTGKPKGVICTHQAVVAFQKRYEMRLKASPGWRIAQTLSPAFDGSILEIFSALSYGATLVLKEKNPLEHLTKVNATMLTPSMAQGLDPSDFPHLEVVYLGGEAVSQTVCDKWASRKEVFNAYGPTEGTCAVTLKPLRQHQPVTLGSPLASSRIYILDSAHNPVVEGVAGEIFLAGIQVSLGYVNSAEQTDRNFSNDLLMPNLGERMYRTGDRGYWDFNGELRILGRRDRQVKLRGYRIDLHGLEKRIGDITSHSPVAVVLKDGDIVAFVKTHTIDVQSTMTRLSREIPDYTLPRRMIAIEQFPMTNSGKLDYKALTKSLDSSRPNGSGNSVEVFSGTQKIIASVWKELLRIDDSSMIRKDSSFFDLGGNSVLQIVLSKKLERQLQRTVPLSMIMQSPTLRILAERLDSNEPPETTSGLEITAVSNASDTTAMENHWWKEYQKKDKGSALTVPFACRLSAEVSREKLEDAWNVILKRHPILRCRFYQDQDSRVRKCLAPTATRVTQVKQLKMCSELRRSFDLQHENPVRVILSRDCLLVMLSHIICDLTSLRLLLREVDMVYNGLPVLDSDPCTSDTSQHRALKRQCLRNVRFWKSYLTEPWHSWRAPGSTSSQDGHHGTSIVSRLPKRTFEAMTRLAQSGNSTLHQVVLATSSLVLTCQNEKTDIVLGSPHFNRSSIEELSKIGLFVQPLPIRVQHPSSNAFRKLVSHAEGAEPGHGTFHSSFLKEVRHSCQAALEHAIPWNELLASIEAHAAEGPEVAPFEVMVSLHDNRREAGFLGQLTEPLFIWTEGAKFKLMIEFTVMSNDVVFARFEYSPRCYSTEGILQLQQMLVTAVDELESGKSYEEIKQALRDVREKSVIEMPPHEARNPYFGAHMGGLECSS